MMPEGVPRLLFLRRRLRAKRVVPRRKLDMMHARRFRLFLGTALPFCKFGSTRALHGSLDVGFRRRAALCEDVFFNRIDARNGAARLADEVDGAE